jgi:hypothetical protein
VPWVPELDRGLTIGPIRQRLSADCVSICDGYPLIVTDGPSVCMVAPHARPEVIRPFGRGFRQQEAHRLAGTVDPSFIHPPSFLPFRACFAGGRVVVSFLMTSPPSSLSVFLFGLVALTGYLLSRPHVWHLRTITSAQGFFPPRLLFSTADVHEWPSMRIESQNLQMDCFTAGESRMRVLSETERKSVASRRDMPRSWGQASDFPSAVGVAAAAALESEADCCWADDAERNVAACCRKEPRE